MHRLSASISSTFRSNNDNNNSKKASLSPVDEFGGSSRGATTATTSSQHGLPPIPQERAKQRRNSQQGNGNTAIQPQQQQQYPSQPRPSAPAPAPPPNMTATPSSQVQQSSTASLHSLPACAQLLNAKKVYKAGYLWRLDGHASSTSSSSTATPKLSSSTSSSAFQQQHDDRPQPQFIKYYMRLEDSILCLWPDEGLKQAQAEGGFIHPTSMNLQDGFVALARTKSEWMDRVIEFNAPTEYCFVLNTAGNNSVTFCVEDEIELQRWINTIRLSIFERQLLENLYTATRLGIKEEQQFNPIRSALSFGGSSGGAGAGAGTTSKVASANKGAKIGRVEGLIDVRLPGDTEWKRVYAVITEPLIYMHNNPLSKRYPSHHNQQDDMRGNATLPMSESRTSLASANTPTMTTSKKEKRRSIFGNLLGGGGSSGNNAASSSSSSTGKDAAMKASQSNDELANSSPVMPDYNTQLEDPNVGPTLALFGILGSTTTSSSSSSSSPPSSHNRRSSHIPSDFANASTVGGDGQINLSSLPSNALKLTKRPICVINQIWSAYAVWPENEALIPHASTFKLHGRINWLEAEVMSYAQSTTSAPGTPGGLGGRTQAGAVTAAAAGPGARAKDPMKPFIEAMRKENRDLGKADNQVQLLCMLVGDTTNAKTSSTPPGPSHAVRAHFGNDTAGELLSWILAFYDAFKLHGRPERMVYDPRNPLSPYFAQPTGPGRGALYFEPALIEDLPQYQDNHPRIVYDGFMRILIERMMKALGRNDLMNAPKALGYTTPPRTAPQTSDQRDSQPQQEQHQQQSERGENKSGRESATSSTPPVLPPNGESRDLDMSPQATPTAAVFSQGSPRGREEKRLLAGQLQQTRSRSPYGDESRSSPSLAGSTGPSGSSRKQDTLNLGNPGTPFLGPGVHQSPGENRSRSADGRSYGSPQLGSDAGRGRPDDRSLQSASYVSVTPTGTSYGTGTASLHSSPQDLPRPGSAASSNGSRNVQSSFARGGQQTGHQQHQQEHLIQISGPDSRVPSRGSHPDNYQEEYLLPDDGDDGNGSSDLQYYNSQRARSDSASRGPSPMNTGRLENHPSFDRAPSALSDLNAPPPPMPGQYVPTPELHNQTNFNDAFARAAPPQSQLLAQHSHQSPAQTSSSNSSQLTDLSSGAAASSDALQQSQHHLQQQNSLPLDNQLEEQGKIGNAAAGVERTDMSSHAPSDNAGDNARAQVGEGDRARNYHDNENSDERVLFDEPGALYAMTFGDNDDTEHHNSHHAPQMNSNNTSRNMQPSVSNLIKARSAVANSNSNNTGDNINSPADSWNHSMTDKTLSAGVPTRQNTSMNTPISAAPTSASEYSQTGTMAESTARSGPPSRSASQHLQQLNQQPLPSSKLSKQVANASDSSAQPPLPTVSTGSQNQDMTRQTKASAASTVPSEGQDDYLAALSYVALAENQEPVIKPPSRPSNNSSTKPSIHIKTDTSKKSNGKASELRQAYSSTDTDTTSAISPTYDEPTSPDPYGAYTEQQSAPPKMRVTNASPEKKARQVTSSDKSRQASMTSQGTTGSSRKPGRKGVPTRTQKMGKKLGTWSSDEDEDGEDDSDKDSVDEEEEAERSKLQEEQRKAAEAAMVAEAERYAQERQREMPNHLRQSTTSSTGSGSFRRSLPGLPGPSTDPYLNHNVSPQLGGFPGQDDRSPRSQDMQYMQQQQQQQYAQQYGDPNRGSMYSQWPGHMPMSGGSVMSPPWSGQHQHSLSGGSGSGFNRTPSPYNNMAPSPSAYNINNGQMGGNQNTMLAYMPDNEDSAAADGKALRNAAVAQHGLLQTGIEQKQQKSAAQIEAMAKETGGPLLQLEHKAQGPQGGLVGAIANHERDRKRDGGLGATLTERERDRRAAEERQRGMDQMGQRQQPMFGAPGFGGPPNFGQYGGMPGMPGMAPGGYGNVGNDPVAMQQQIAMLAAQNAYLQAMASFNQNGLMAAQQGPQSFMSPSFSPNMGYGGGPGSQAPYAGSYMGMAPPSHSPNQMQGHFNGSPGFNPGQHPNAHGRSGSRTQSGFFGP